MTSSAGRQSPNEEVVTWRKRNNSNLKKPMKYQQAALNKREEINGGVSDMTAQWRRDISNQYYWWHWWNDINRRVNIQAKGIQSSRNDVAALAKLKWPIDIGRVTPVKKWRGQWWRLFKFQWNIDKYREIHWWCEIESLFNRRDMATSGVDMRGQENSGVNQAG